MATDNYSISGKKHTSPIVGYASYYIPAYSQYVWSSTLYVLFDNSQVLLATTLYSCWLTSYCYPDKSQFQVVNSMFSTLLGKYIPSNIRLWLNTWNNMWNPKVVQVVIFLVNSLNSFFGGLKIDHYHLVNHPPIRMPSLKKMTFAQNAILSGAVKMPSISIRDPL